MYFPDFFSCASSWPPACGDCKSKLAKGAAIHIRMNALLLPRPEFEAYRRCIKQLLGHLACPNHQVAEFVFFTADMLPLGAIEYNRFHQGNALTMASTGWNRGLREKLIWFALFLELRACVRKVVPLRNVLFIMICAIEVNESVCKLCKGPRTGICDL